MKSFNHFNIKGLKSLLSPFYLARKSLDHAVLRSVCNIRGKVLDVGCGSRPYEAYFKNCEYVGVDVETEFTRSINKADVFYDGKTLPFANGEFDVVFSTQVLEHTFYPDDFISEAARVLNTNGRLILSVPLIWGEHEQPYDFGRYTSFGISFMIEKHGLKISNMEKLTSGHRAIIQLTLVYLYNRTGYSNALIRRSTRALFAVFLNTLAILLDYVLPIDDEMYLDNFLIAEKK